MQTIHYIIYQITNNINGKIYIGKHQTTNLNDNYFGSGKLLRQAIEKYGLENFTKEILYVFDNELEMNEKEKELVPDSFVKESTNYNLCVGGKGGFSYINENVPFEDRGFHFINKNKLNNKANQNLKGGLKFKELFRTNENFRKDWLEKHKTAISDRPNPFSGKKHSQETKNKMRESAKGKHCGSLNSQHGTMWITDGTKNKKIKRTELVPNGWYRGRSL